MSLKPKRVDFGVVWHDIKETVEAVVTLSKVPRGVWNDRFSDVYSLCVAQPESLADRLYQETKSFLDQHVHKLLDEVKGNGEAELLRSYNRAWNDYSRGVDYVHKLYLYLNQQHIKKQKLSEAEVTYGSFNTDQQEQMKEIGELGLDIWKQNMVRALQSLLLKQLLEAMEADRNGKGMSQSPSVVQGVILSLVAVEEYKKKAVLDLYEEVFEKPFLEASGKFYRQESTRLFQDCTVSQYMERVLQKLEEEQLRARKFLHPSSFAKVTTEFQQRLVGDRLEQLHAECHPLVQQESHHDLRNLFTLLRPLSGTLAPLVQEVQSHIQRQGLEAVANLSGETMHVQFVENILEVHRKYQAMIREVFSGDQQFVGALDKACASVINHRPGPKQPCRSSEMLAKYCDNLLKKSAKGLSESEIEDKLAQSITVFKYIDDKDVFQKFYARMLAKRLIHQQSQAMDAEEAMINRLKQACGYEFTNKLHRMFTDVAVSSDLNSKFSSHLTEKQSDLGIHFTVYVLQAGAWPLGQSAVTPFALPRELERSVQAFEAFYRAQFNGRKLTWLHHLCQGELRLGYLKRTYLVTMQTFQMAILLHFEKHDSIRFKELQEMTQLADDQFSRHVQSLLECRLLLSDNEDLSTDPLLSLNMEYSNKRTKLRISAAVQRESAQEIEQTHLAVDEDRKLYLQATIVRIMKSRKLLKHNTLIQEVLGQSRARFAPSISMIKKCVETLIDKQYLERTPNSADEYSYVA